MKDLVLLYGTLTTYGFSSRDDPPHEGLDPLRISPELRAKLRNRMNLLETLRAEIQREKDDDGRYPTFLDGLRTVVSHEKLVPQQGSVYINRITGGGSYFAWWTCERKHRTEPDRKPMSPCDKGARDELRTCARVGGTYPRISPSWSSPFLT